ncbi:MAG: tetratricopeptide repeat protein [Chitinophagaceae bacterium]
MLKKTLTIGLLAITTFAFAGEAQQQSLRPNSDSADFYLQKALIEKQAGRLQLTLKHLEKALSFEAGNKAVLTQLAPVYFELRKYHQSKETYKQLVDLGDRTAVNYQQLVNLSFNLKQQDDVILYAEKLKAVDPSAKISFYVGKVHYEQENYGEAIKYLTAASKEDPANAEAPYMIARSYADMLNYKLCVPFFQKAIELDPSKNSWMYELGLIYYAMHEDKQALKYILMAGENGYKKDNEYLENLGIAYLNSGNLEEGVKILGEILKKRPSDLNVLNMVAEAYYYKGKYQQAIDYWDQVLTYDKQNASALYMIGMSYQKKGDKEKGQLLCDKAIEMDPALAALKQKKSMPGL